MIKVLKVVAENLDGSVVVELFADEKPDTVPTTGTGIINLPDSTPLSAGSSIITASGEVAFLKSTEEWNWL